MVVKYLKGGSWVYLDKVLRVDNSALLPMELAKQFDEEVKAGKREALDSVDADTDLVNKAFSMAIENQQDWGYNVHAENILHADFIRAEWTTLLVLIHRPKVTNPSDFADYDTIALVTNQNVFLMNDEGKTIERLL
jgi:hypothetical protein